MKRKLFVIISCILLLIFAQMWSPTQAKYVFEHRLFFDTLIENLNGNGNICSTFDDIEFTIPEGQASYGNISSITDGNKNYDATNTDQNWSNYAPNWSNRKNAGQSILTFEWGVPTSLSEIDLYYFIDNNTRVPKSVSFRYKNSNGNWISLTNVTETKNYVLQTNGTQVSTINGVAWSTSYTGIAPASFFQIDDNLTDVVAIEITLNAMNSRNKNFHYCVGLIECELYT